MGLLVFAPGTKVLRYGTAATRAERLTFVAGTSVHDACVTTRVENGDGGSPAATRVAVRTALSRCHARIRLVARRQRPE